MDRKDIENHTLWQELNSFRVFDSSICLLSFSKGWNSTLIKILKLLQHFFVSIYIFFFDEYIWFTISRIKRFLINPSCYRAEWIQKIHLLIIVHQNFDPGLDFLQSQLHMFKQIRLSWDTGGPRKSKTLDKTYVFVIIKVIFLHSWFSENVNMFKSLSYSDNRKSLEYDDDFET